MYKYSIIVPVYQSEKYLEECICSVIKQKEQNWELILIDDGSTDKSPEICDWYAEKYSQIKVRHKKNAGPLIARYVGYTMAQGTYVLSLDSDDRLEEHALQKINETLDQMAVDILIFSYQRINQNGTIVPGGIRLKNKIYSNLQKPELFQILWEKNAFNLVWNKVFRTDFILSTLQIPEKLKKVKAGDDAVIVTPLLIQAEKIKTVHNVLYEYRILPNSISRNFNLQKGNDLVMSRSYMLEQIQNAGLLNNAVETWFYKVTYQTISYMLWQCAKSNSPMKEKKQFCKNISCQKLYQDSLSYSEMVNFSNWKKVSLWLFEHNMFRIFIYYEKIQKLIKEKFIQ